MATLSTSPTLDKEKHDVSEGIPPSTKESLSIGEETTDAEPSHAIVARFGALGPFLAKLFELGVEARGVERIPENKRDATYFWNK